MARCSVPQGTLRELCEVFQGESGSCDASCLLCSWTAPSPSSISPCLLPIPSFLAFWERGGRGHPEGLSLPELLFQVKPIAKPLLDSDLSLSELSPSKSSALMDWTCSHIQMAKGKRASPHSPRRAAQLDCFKGSNKESYLRSFHFWVLRNSASWVPWLRPLCCKDAIAQGDNVC